MAGPRAGPGLSIDRSRQRGGRAVCAHMLRRRHSILTIRYVVAEALAPAIRFDSKTDSENPKNWSFRRKVLITMLYGLTTMCSTFASSVFSPATELISQQYGISTEVAILGLALFIAGYVPGPIIFAPISELYGRKISVLAPMIIFICFTAGTATAENLQTIFITRFFAGVMASSPVATVGGGLADMFDQKERGTAVVFYSLAVVAGPTLGPIIGGAVSQSSLGWRWTEYLSLILTSAVVLADVFFLPETFAPVLLTRKARRLRLKTGRWALHSRQEMQEYTLRSFMEKNLLRPLRMLATEPMVFLTTIYNSFAYGILYLLFAAVPIIYEENRGWSTLVGSLPFLGVLVGTILAAAINISYSRYRFAPLVEKHGRVDPEHRLPPMMIGAVTFPIGFFLLGWTSSPSIHWFPGVLGLMFIGMSFLLIFQAGINYLIDAYTKYSASAVAANTFMRSFFAAGLPLVAQPLFHNLGIDWACTLLGCVSVLLAVVPFLFYAFGKRLRTRSRMAADDL
ncbi:MFS general substrate transporter [Punctularia strigosozonata HHB-11173 SS5]|uniref:MFS general substrate transporter n=1 Tax=Punctularia strigosozonata (strain HHB-11173) TaxID=741275 RepID=UPI000441711D|nr:MFS general substrate transporter [Punctularia strigosozonata HHB-11173 SS5]EIN08811.1 MFS general substrate transporter [Punctularia strigosozonata HHB-11173 SS5]